MWRYSFACLGLLACFVSGKVWRPTAEMNDPENWRSKALPSDCDRISLAKATGMTVRLSVSQSIRIASILFSRNGVLQLPTTGSTNFPAAGLCPKGSGSVAEMLQGTKAWLDPANWIPDSSNWVPHNLRIPCTSEQVIFPQDSAINVQLPTIILPRRTITVLNQSMDMAAWSQYLQSESGLEHFKGNPEVRRMEWPQNEYCASIKGCFCGRGATAIRDWSFQEISDTELIEAICSYVRPRCATTESPDCDNPIFPHGHCCGVCGAFLVMADDTLGVPLRDVETVVTDSLHTSGLNLKYHVGRLSNGDVQVVLLSPEDDVSDSIYVINDISETLSQRIGMQRLLTMKYSGFSKKNSLFRHISGITFGTLLAIVAFFASIYYIYIVLPKQKWLAARQSFTFARFHNAADEPAEDSVVLTTDSYNNPMFTSESSPRVDQQTSLEPDEDIEQGADQELVLLKEQPKSEARSTSDDLAPPKKVDDGKYVPTANGSKDIEEDLLLEEEFDNL